MVGSPSSLPTFEVKVQLSTIDFKWILLYAAITI
jgi:hypothetical protein